MAKRTRARQALPVEAQQALASLGRNIEMARRRRKQSRTLFAERLYVSVPTVRRLEAGDPGVGLGVLASALWVLGLWRDLEAVATPANDSVGIALEYRRSGTGRGKGRREDDF